MVRLVCVVVLAVLTAGCAAGDGPASSTSTGLQSAADNSSASDVSSAGESTPDTEDPTEPAATAPTPIPTPTSTPAPPVVVRGTVVSAADGSPVPAAIVTIGELAAKTGADGTFVIEDVPAVLPAAGVEVVVERPAWTTVAAIHSGLEVPLTIEMEPFTVRALRVSEQVAGDATRFADLLALADETVVNTLVFDTKDESDRVLYETDVALAHEIGAVDPVYVPGALLALARERGLYTVTRIVTFEDGLWARGVPEAHLAGTWVNAADPANWDYPLGLAVEACELGFDEVQFDYVRFPSGTTAARAASLVPQTDEERSAAIAGFLGAARDLLHPMGCGVSAAIFGIVMSSATDERLGQTPEAVSAVVDAVSPMLYPSHYSPGWLGFADPNDHPGPVVAYALDQGQPRLAPGALMRPWIQGFYYNGAQVLAQIDEAEARGAGWIIWNAFGEYRRDWLPSASPD